MKKVTAYKCDFCTSPKLYLSKSGCQNHEKMCWLNPARKSCATCANLVNYFADEEGSTAWRCTELKHVIPFKQKIDRCLYWMEGDIFSGDME